MADFNLTTIDGEYSNTDVFDRTLGYIFKLNNPHKYYMGVYPATLDGAITFFTQTYDINYLRSSDQKVWHMVLSADCHDCRSRKSHRSCTHCHKMRDLFHFSNCFANLLCSKYQVCYALHDNEEGLHFHFVISTTSYQFCGVPLSMEILKTVYLPQLRQIIRSSGYSFYFIPPTQGGALCSMNTMTS